MDFHVRFYERSTEEGGFEPRYGETTCWYAERHPGGIKVVKSTANGCFGWKMADCFVEPLSGVERSNAHNCDSHDVSHNNFIELKPNIGNLIDFKCN